MLILVPLAKAVKTVGLSYRLLSSSVMLTSLTFSLIQSRKRKKQSQIRDNRETKE
jgi:hypothetical protein